MDKYKNNIKISLTILIIMFSFLLDIWVMPYSSMVIGGFLVPIILECV